jgi:hypothetical protein
MFVQASRLFPVLVIVLAVSTTVLVLGETASYAAEKGVVVLAEPASLNVVIDRIRVTVLSVIGSAALLFFTIGAARYLAADGDSGEAERGKRTMRNVVLGTCLALLAPLLLTIAEKWVA